MLNAKHSSVPYSGPFTKTIILKITSRCNLNCTYCHWFRDENVYLQPPVIKIKTYDALMSRLSTYLNRMPLKILKFIFHGGEPLLIKKDFFIYMCESLKKIEKESNKKIYLGITTNGVLITQEWIDIFRKYHVNLAISLDGDILVNDKNRLDLKGRGSYDKTLSAIRKLQKNYSPFSILAVCQPQEDPELICEHFVNFLKIKNFDILIPNNNHDDVYNNQVKPISDFYIRLFDLWMNKYRAKGVKIRIVNAFIKALLAKKTNISGIGFSPVDAIAITPSGEIGPLDALRINGTDQITTELTVFNNELEEVFLHPLWMFPFEQSLVAPEPCQTCNIKLICRGGNIIHRYSSKNGYNNRSIYCDDLIKIYSHVSRQLLQFSEN